MSRGKKIAIGVGGGIVALAAIGSIGDSGDKSKPEASSSGSSISAPKASQAAPAAPAVPKTKEAAAAGSAVRDGKFEFQVLGVGRSATKDGIFSPEEAKGEFYTITIRVTNIGDEAQTYFGSNQKLLIDGKEYESSSSLSDESWMEELNPGLGIDTTVMFDIPATAVPTAVEFHDSAFSGGAVVALPPPAR
jgi:hypothetical protein